MRIVGLALLIFFLSPAQAQESLIFKYDEKSILWQKAELERHIQSRLVESVSGIVDHSQFVVSIQLKLKEKPSTGLTIVEPKNLKAEGLFPLTKLGMWTRQKDLEANINRDQNNIFDQIVSADVGLIVDEDVEETKVKIIESVINNIVKYFGSFSVSINIQKLKLVHPPKPPRLNWLDWIDKFKNPIGLIFSTLLLFFLGIIFSRKYQNLESQKMSIMQSQVESSNTGTTSEQDVEEPDKTVKPTHEINGFEGMSELRLNGFKKFQSVIKADPRSVTIMVKQWLSSKDNLSKSALIWIPKFLTMDEMNPLFDSLSEEDRKMWKGVLKEPAENYSVFNADSFILNQIMENVLVPPVPAEDEIKGMIAGLSPEECALLAKDSVETGAILFNVLSTIQVSKMMDFLEEDQIDKISEVGLSFDLTKAKDSLGNVQSKVNQIVGNRKSEKLSPFAEKTLELIQFASPSREQRLIGNLIKAKQFNLIEKATKNHFPYQLIFELDERFLRQALMHLPLIQRAELLIVLEEQQREKIVNSLKENERLLEMLTSQESELKANEKDLVKIKKREVEVQQLFAKSIRSLAKQEESFTEATDEILSKWLNKISGGEISGGQSEAA